MPYRSTPPRKGALAALLVGAFAIGCSPIFVRLSEVGPVATAFWRLSLAIPLLALLFMRNESQGEARPRHWRDHVAAAAPGVLLGVELIIWHLSLQLTTVTSSTLFSNMAPIFVALGGWLFLKQPVNRIFIAGLVLSILGALLLMGGLKPGEIAATWRGDLLALLAAVLYAVYIVQIGWSRRRFSTGSIMLWSSVAGALTTLPAALLLEPRLFPATLFGWAIIIGLAWVSQVAGQSLITFSLAWLPVAFSSLTLLIQPVVAAALAWILLGETLAPLQIAGGVIVLAGIYLARRSQMNS